MLERELQGKIAGLPTLADEASEEQDGNYSNKLYSSGSEKEQEKHEKVRENYGSPIKKQGSIIEIY